MNFKAIEGLDSQNIEEMYNNIFQEKVKLADCWTRGRFCSFNSPCGRAECPGWTYTSDHNNYVEDEASIQCYYNFYYCFNNYCVGNWEYCW